MTEKFRCPDGKTRAFTEMSSGERVSLGSKWVIRDGAFVSPSSGKTYPSDRPRSGPVTPSEVWEVIERLRVRSVRVRADLKRTKGEN